MPATLTSAGTWTTLNVDLAPYRMVAQSTTTNPDASFTVPTLLNLQAGDFALNGRINIPPEVFQMIGLIQSGYASGANRVGFWEAAALLRAWLAAVFSGETATTPTNSIAPGPVT